MDNNIWHTVSIEGREISELEIKHTIALDHGFDCWEDYRNWEEEMVLLSSTDWE